MAYSTCDTNALRDAILRMWTPVVGAKSLYEVIVSNQQKIYASFGHDNFYGRLMASRNIPMRPFFPSGQDYSDNQPPFEIAEEILSGSWSEGLFLYGHSKIKIPDMDYMLVLKNISFSKEDQLSGNLTLKEDTPYVYAYITDEDSVKMWNEFLADRKDVAGKRLSSRKLKEKLHQNYKKLPLISQSDNSNDVDDGAAMYINRVDYATPSLKAASKVFTNQIGRNVGNMIDFSRELKNEIFTGSDIVLAISCEGWPCCAIEWINRDRIWPHRHVVQKITEDGFHIVPKRSTEGDFRLSFSSAETKLIENLTELQHKVLRCFKAVVKYYQDTWSPNIKEIITTYHLKTIAFWHFEKITQDSITKETVVTHLILLLQELANALRVRELPMYFMPKVNLFENVENSEEAIKIAEKIDQLAEEYHFLIIALENITYCFRQPLGLASFKMGEFPDFSSRLQKTGKSSGVQNPSEGMMQELFTCLDSMKGLRACLNPMTYMKSTPRNERTVPEQTDGTAMSTNNSTILQQFYLDTGEFIDLD